VQTVVSGLLQGLVAGHIPKADLAWRRRDEIGAASNVQELREKQGAGEMCP